MTKGLAALARRAAQAREVMIVRGGGGGPLARRAPPSQTLAEEDELIWDDGTANPEPALDEFNMISKNGALAWFLGGLGVFGLIFTGAALSHPEKRVPWTQKEVLLPPEIAKFNTR